MTLRSAPKSTPDRPAEIALERLTRWLIVALIVAGAALIVAAALTGIFAGWVK